ncbi:DUF7547 family protein [Halorussus marinus]|uniref:DUF7547 family protein n=1 Tax=Halorussus marinus TaxID=2505976 RepID=UPI001B2FFB1E|nr:hypothetical protein [Halorussus marinus]
MRDDRDREELEERVRELEDRVRELRDELGEPPRGPGGLPRPPTPREVLSFTGEYAIPTTISVLEANIRALKALERIIRVVDPERSAVGEERDRLESRAADASRATLDRLEDALEDVEATIRESDLPRDGEARDILDDARRINREIRDRVEQSRADADEARNPRRDDRDTRDDRRDRDDLDGATTIEVGDPDDRDEDDAEDDAGEPQVDVDAELRSIKDELDGDRRADGDGSDGDDSAATDGEDSAEADAGTDGQDSDDTDDGTDADGSDGDGGDSNAA